MSTFDNNELSTAYELGVAEVQLHEGLPGLGRPFLTLPADKKVEALDRFLPARREAQHRFATAEALLAYAEAFVTPTTEWFGTADLTKGCALRAEFDYLPRTLAKGGERTATTAGGERKHAATWVARHSPEWAAWTRLHAVPLSQQAFADHLDDWGYCCQVPDAATLLEVAETLEMHQTAVARGVSRRKDGSGGSSYQVTIETKAGATGALTVPDRLTVFLPVFEGGEPVVVNARVRIRLKEGVPSFALHFDRLHEALQGAMARVFSDVEVRFETRVYREHAV